MFDFLLTSIDLAVDAQTALLEVEQVGRSIPFARSFLGRALVSHRVNVFTIAGEMKLADDTHRPVDLSHNGHSAHTVTLLGLSLFGAVMQQAPFGRMAVIGQ